MDALAQFEARQITQESPVFKAGDVVRVHQKVKEGDKQRIQIFEGLVIARKHGKGPRATFTVRKIASGVGVEKIYPLHSPFIAKVEIVKRMKTRRAKLYYIRSAKGKKARMKELRGFMPVAQDDVVKQQENVPQENSAQETPETSVSEAASTSSGQAASTSSGQAAS